MNDMYAPVEAVEYDIEDTDITNKQDTGQT